jgi:hypothetical protein
MHALINANIRINKDKWTTTENRVVANEILTIEPSSAESLWTHILGQKILQLWNNEPLLHDMYAIRHTFQFPVANAVDLITQFETAMHQPTNDMLLRTYRKTTGATQWSFFYSNSDEKDILFTTVDTGGQRNERRKWAHHCGMFSFLFLTK